MNTRKSVTGFRLLMVFYCFIVFQRLTTRGQFHLNTAFEAVYVGTLIYLVYGFFRRERASRWVAMLFHAVFQMMETFTVFLCFDPKVLDILLKQLPAGTGLQTVRAALVAVYLFITGINVAAVVFLWKNPWYFEGKGKEAEEAV